MGPNVHTMLTPPSRDALRKAESATKAVEEAFEQRCDGWAGSEATKRRKELKAELHVHMDAEVKCRMHRLEHASQEGDTNRL